MAEILDYFDRINIDVAKRKYYNVNKVNSVLEELHSLAVELVDENERQRQELIQLREQLGQRTADGQQSRELLNSMQSLYRDTLAKAHSRADGIVQEAEIQRDKLAKYRNGSSASDSADSDRRTVHCAKPSAQADTTDCDCGRRRRGRPAL